MLQEGAQFRILDLLELEQHFTTNGPVRKLQKVQPVLAACRQAIVDPFTLEKHGQELPSCSCPTLLQRSLTQGKGA